MNAPERRPAAHANAMPTPVNGNHKQNRNFKHLAI